MMMAMDDLEAFCITDFVDHHDMMMICWWWYMFMYIQLWYVDDCASKSVAAVDLLHIGMERGIIRLMYGHTHVYSSSSWLLWFSADPQHTQCNIIKITSNSKNHFVTLLVRNVFLTKSYTFIFINRPSKLCKTQNIHHWKMFTPEKHSSLKNIQPWEEEYVTMRTNKWR